MTMKQKKNIGSQQGLICVGLGVIIAQLIMTAMIHLTQNLFKAFFWFAE
jgi:hypothetical protein